MKDWDKSPFSMFKIQRTTSSAFEFALRQCVSCPQRSSQQCKRKMCSTCCRLELKKPDAANCPTHTVKTPEEKKAAKSNAEEKKACKSNTRKAAPKKQGTQKRAKNKVHSKEGGW